MKSLFNRIWKRIRGEPYFVITEDEATDPWKVEMRDALNSKDKDRINAAYSAYQEKQAASQQNEKFH